MPIQRLAAGRCGPKHDWVAGVGIAIEIDAPLKVSAQAACRGSRYSYNKCKVVDGSGGPWRQASVAIKGDYDCLCGQCAGAGEEGVDAPVWWFRPALSTCMPIPNSVCPFDGRGLSMVTQGVTTEVLGEHLSAGRYGPGSR